ncbi:hypothetical protein D512_28198 [Burkholderia pseudomallei MSHR1043]|nr:hypothetical protein BMA10247_A0156 [Burkholderia mallei NCTC 10247]EDP87293.1 hypothetical protein BMA10399_B1500 [Burkholderia mallei ATCC 10399]EEP84489.1 conserved hypothetical protein [Burkholderia mallei GB8 horse 4]EMP73859.1 hypothetical protein D512_28198 [Burkholderia pseudomallei MSHR1043]
MRRCAARRAESRARIARRFACGFAADARIVNAIAPRAGRG